MINAAKQSSGKRDGKRIKRKVLESEAAGAVQTAPEELRCPQIAAARACFPGAQLAHVHPLQRRHGPGECMDD